MKNKNIEKFKNLKIELVKIKYTDKLDKLENALKELNKIEVFGKILHELKLKYGEIMKVNLKWYVI